MKVRWTSAREFEDIRYEKSGDGIAKVTINRPEVRNAFQPKTVMEMQEAFADIREDPEVGVAILTGEGPATRRRIPSGSRMRSGFHVEPGVQGPGRVPRGTS